MPHIILEHFENASVMNFRNVLVSSNHFWSDFIFNVSRKYVFNILVYSKFTLTCRHAVRMTCRRADKTLMDLCILGVGGCCDMVGELVAGRTHSSLPSTSNPPCVCSTLVCAHSACVLWMGEAGQCCGVRSTSEISLSRTHTQARGRRRLWRASTTIRQASVGDWPGAQLCQRCLTKRGPCGVWKASVPPPDDYVQYVFRECACLFRSCVVLMNSSLWFTSERAWTWTWVNTYTHGGCTLRTRVDPGRRGRIDGIIRA